MIKEDNNFFNFLLMYLCMMHRRWWTLKLSFSEIIDFGAFVVSGTNMINNSSESFFIPQLKIELGHKIKELHLSWFASGLNWIMIEKGIIQEYDILPCKISKFWGKATKLFTSGL